MSRRGRHFDESTLPPRVHYTRSTRRTQATQPILDTGSSHPTPKASKSPSKADSLLSPGPAQRSRGPSPRRGSPLPPSKQQKPQVIANGEGQDVEEAPVQEIDAIKAQEDVNGGDSQIITPPSSALEVPLDPTAKATSDGKSENVDADADEEKSSGETASPMEPAPEQSKRGPSPLVLAPVTNGTDPQSSPASTDEHDSNTPAPERGSPNTSPEDEDPSVASARFNQSRPDSSKAPTIPRQPDTPDSTQAPAPHEPSAMDVDTEEVAAVSNAEQSSKPDDTHAQAAHESSSRKPAMRIDTQTNDNALFRPNAVVESPAPMTNTAATPRKGPPPTPSQDSSKRATRISSGVLQKKSVSEILGETPKATSAADPMDTIDSPGLMQDRERRDKDRRGLSTVVFAKPQKHAPDGDTIDLIRPEARDGQEISLHQKDYLYSLFENKAYSISSRMHTSRFRHQITWSTISFKVNVGY
jgi:chromatin modification-related protein VID21